MYHLVQDAKIVEALKPQAGAALTGDYVSLKNYARAFVLVHINQANAAVVAITIEQASVVAGTDTKVITKAVPIWANLDCVASDALAAATAAVGYTTDAGTKDKLVVFEIDPCSLDVANGFDCITVKTAASNAANITSALYLLVKGRDTGATPASAIVD